MKKTQQDIINENIIEQLQIRIQQDDNRIDKLESTLSAQKFMTQKLETLLQELTEKYQKLHIHHYGFEDKEL